MDICPYCQRTVQPKQHWLRLNYLLAHFNYRKDVLSIQVYWGPWLQILCTQQLVYYFIKIEGFGGHVSDLVRIIRVSFLINGP